MSQENKSEDGLPKIDQALANDASIVKGHARARREGIPGSPIAFFMMSTFLIVLTFAFFVGRRYIQFDEKDIGEAGIGQRYLYKREMVLKEPGPPPVVVVDGAKIYSTYCVTCHLPTGLGVPGAFPPLADSEWVNDGDGNVPIRVVLAGLQGPVTVKGQSYNGAMIPFGPALNDEEIAAVVTHIRSTWGNESSEVTSEQVAEIRSEIGSRGQWTEDELKKFF